MSPDDSKEPSDPLARVRAGFPAIWDNGLGDLVIHRPHLGTVPIAKRELGALLGFTREMRNAVFDARQWLLNMGAHRDSVTCKALEAAVPCIESCLPLRTEG